VNTDAQHPRPRDTPPQATARPKKRFGQHFLVSQRVLSGILRLAEVSSEDRVVEIGAGTGALTAALAGQAREVVALEVDRDLIGALQQRFASQPHVQIVHADALRFDFAQIAPPFKVVANLPYGSATAILMRLLERPSPMSLAVVMLQREVAARLYATPGTKAYGSLTLMAQWYATIDKGFNVPPAAFSPAPKVMSTVVKITPRPEPPVEVRDEPLLFRVIHGAFAQRRKILVNALAAALSDQLTASLLARALTAAGVDPRRRGETLTLTEFARLTDGISAVMMAQSERPSPPSQGKSPMPPCSELREQD